MNGSQLRKDQDEEESLVNGVGGGGRSSEADDNEYKDRGLCGCFAG